MSLPTAKFILALPHCFFRCHRAPPYHPKIVNGEPKEKFDRAPVRSVFGTSEIWSRILVRDTKSTFLCGGAARARFFWPPIAGEGGRRSQLGPLSKKSPQSCTGEIQEIRSAFSRGPDAHYGGLSLWTIVPNVVPSASENYNPLRSGSAPTSLLVTYEAAPG
jgi:hypothetical protein